MVRETVRRFRDFRDSGLARGKKVLFGCPVETRSDKVDRSDNTLTIVIDFIDGDRHASLHSDQIP